MGEKMNEYYDEIKAFAETGDCLCDGEKCDSGKCPLDIFCDDETRPWELDHKEAIKWINENE